MSAEPFFRDEPHLRDEPADTRKEVVTIHPDDELYGVDTPPTYAMGLAERLAALHADAQSSSVEIVMRQEGRGEPFEETTVSIEDLDLDEPLEDFDLDEQFERKTLPSAPYPPAILDDGAAALSWDVLPPPVPTFADAADLPFAPSSDPAPSVEVPSARPSSIWGKLQKFVTGISKPRSQPPVSSASSRRLSQRAIFELVWTFDNAALDALAAHIERIIAARRLGPEAYAESRIVDLLDQLTMADRGHGDGICISILRARIPEVARAMFDHALLSLENRGVVALLPDEPGLDGIGGLGAKNADGDSKPHLLNHGIDDPVRGHLSRCLLLQTAS